MQSYELAQCMMKLLQDIDFGSVEILVHAGRVGLIDRHERFRVKIFAAH